MAALGSSGGGGGVRRGSGGERTARIKGLELALNKRMLKHNLATGGGAGRTGRSAPAAVAGSGVPLDMDMEAKREMVGERLDRRASLQELSNQGIFQVHVVYGGRSWCFVVRVAPGQVKVGRWRWPPQCFPGHEYSTVYCQTEGGAAACATLIVLTAAFPKLVEHVITQ